MRYNSHELDAQALPPNVSSQRPDEERFQELTRCYGLGGEAYG
jgi:hypothetical protein